LSVKTTATTAPIAAKTSIAAKLYPKKFAIIILDNIDAPIPPKSMAVFISLEVLP